MARAPATFPMYPGSVLTGDTVWNRQGEDLGVLKRIMIDAASGRIAYGVLACGGVLGIGAKLFAVPWRAFTFDAERQCFMLDVTRERLERARGIDQDHWPASAEAAWARAMHDAGERSRHSLTERFLH